MQGMKRVYEALLQEYLDTFPCVAIIGSRQCGKTTMLGTLPNDWQRYDLERANDYQLVTRDPDLFLRLNPDKIAIDEAQLFPDLFKALRVAIDDDRRPGRFVVTGSSSPELMSSVSESLAGRVGIIELSPFGFSEIYTAQDSPLGLITDNSCDLADLMKVAKPKASLSEAHEYWFRGGYPEPWLSKSERARKLWVEQFMQTYVQRDISQLFPNLNRDRFSLFLQLLGGLSGTIINYSDTARALGISAPTVRDYFEIAHGSFIWRLIPSFSRNSYKRLVRHPKGYVRDSGLLHHLLRLPDLKALLGHPQMGNSWEGMVIEEILRHLNANGIGFDYYHYRTSGGAEVDLVLEGDFGLLPIEIKYSQTVHWRSLKSMREFIDHHDCKYGIVVQNSDKPVMYDDKIIGIPFNCL